ncbi:MAG TPA: hypothetical protein VGA61_02310, partial [Anaerolineae bacterium]
MPDSDIRILETEAFFRVERARTPLKFGAVIQDAITLCHVRVRAENRRGAVAEGWGAIFLSDFWAFPTPAIPHETKDLAMRRLVDCFCRRLASFPGFAHPLDIFTEVEGDLSALNRQAGAEAGLAEEMPYLA